jgi:hypothetical protein
MNPDSELDLFRAKVNCAAILENFGQPWRLDARESTRRALKYRRGEGEVLIVTHEGRGWWDPQSSAKGDVFTLVQHLDPSLNFGHVRQVLRRFVGMTPRYTPAERGRGGQGDARSVADRWVSRPRLRIGCAAWDYLVEARALPAGVLAAAAEQDIIRDGAYGSAWFAHLDQRRVTHVEIRGPSFKGSLKSGHKTLFRLRPGAAETTRLVVAEAPIDALSLVAIEGLRADSLYVATGGGMGPGTLAALQTICVELATRPGSVVESAADANRAGDRYAERHADIARSAGVAFRRLRPPEGLDWNDVQQGRGS